MNLLYNNPKITRVQQRVLAHEHRAIDGQQYRDVRAENIARASGVFRPQPFSPRELRYAKA